MATAMPPSSAMQGNSFKHAARHTATPIPRIRRHVHRQLPQRSDPRERSRLGGTWASQRRAHQRAVVVASSAAGTAASLASSLQGYRVFPMDGCSFMIKETPDQKLVITDAFVTDDVTGEPKQLSFSTPAALVPPTSFQEIEWAAEYPGNDFEDKAAVRWVLKTYLIALGDDGVDCLDFDRVVLLDAASQSISFPSVTRLAPPDTPDEFLELRIRDSGLVIDTIESLPDAESVVRSRLSGVPATSHLERELGSNTVVMGQEETDGAGDQEEDVYDLSIEDDSEDLDDFLDSGDGDEIDSDDEEFEGDGEMEDDGDDFE